VDAIDHTNLGHHMDEINIVDEIDQMMKFTFMDGT
jgi:hypothetical protein